VTLAGIVLAGGRGRRLGGAGKAAIQVGGDALVDRAVAALREAGCDPVLVVARPGVAIPTVDVPVVADAPGPAGPVNAIRTGMAHVDTDDVIVLACDLPFAAPVTARLARRPAGPAVLGVDPDGRPQPLCARYPRRPALAAARAAVAAGDARVIDWARRIGEWHREEATARELLNVNTAEDLARARTP